MPAKPPTSPPLAFGKLLARALADKVLPPLPAKTTPAIKSTQPIYY
jgi:hypothetical protein